MGKLKFSSLSIVKTFVSIASICGIVIFINNASVQILCAKDKGYKIIVEEGASTGVFSGTCSQCGKSVTGGKSFCPYCGAQFNNAYNVIKPFSETVIITTDDQKKIAAIAIAKGDDDLWVGQAAVEKLFDQKLLADVAKKSNSAKVGGAAIKKIVSQNLLVDVAKHSKNTDISMCAMAKLTDQALLTDIAKNDKDWYLRHTAVEMITDQAILANVAKYDEDSRVRAAAVERVTDQATLSYIAKNDEDKWGVRSIAISKITDKSLLAEIDKTNKEFRLFKADGWTPVILSVSKINFYESSGDDSTDVLQRAYKTKFVGTETRCVSWVLTLEHPDPGCRIDFVIEEIWTDPDGLEIAHQQVNTYIQAGWTNSYRDDGWGSRTPGAVWKPGIYFIELRTGDQHIAIASFEVM